MKNTSVMSAEQVGHAAYFDPNFNLPKKPRLMASLQMIPDQDSLLFHGTENLQVLKGNAVTRFLPKLIPFLNGAYSLEGIIKEFDQYSPRDVSNILSLLFMRGLLDDAEGDEGVDISHFDADVLHFFQRSTDSTRVNRSAAEGLNRLKTAKILLLTDSDHGKILQDELLFMGADHVRAELLSDEVKLDQATNVIVFCTNPLNHERLLSLDHLCREKNIPWLLTRVTEECGVVGPYFEKNETAAYHDYKKTVESEENNGASDLDHIEMWEYYSAIEIAYFITRLAPSATGSEYLTFQFNDWTSTSKKVHPRPDGICASGSSENELHPALQFENAIAFPSKHLINPKSHQVHYNPKNLLLTNEAKNYPSAALTVLPKEESLPHPKGSFLKNRYEPIPVKEELNLESLTRLFLTSGGLRDAGSGQVSDKVQRWAPTGGNLGSCQIYILALSVKGLVPNCYYYQHLDHSLAKIGPSLTEEEIKKQMTDITGLTEDQLPKALVFFTGAYERVASKYNGFAYKVIHLDAGVALSQMHAVSTGLGITLSAVDQWNEQELITCLGLDPKKEPVTAVAGIDDGR
ncbi:SagB family peptide dehydrogenase [Bacillus atrophaeus]|uniref:SagB family peptide dehydrogenase n=1 Tax=Bacillus atrophaeus TaxID=1452 RepID=UPI00227E5258|nr:SagB family peptide dehydrogenase [Bacillus atrophaeus]MCY9160800.1 SagB family peptide dehydrogenase [Bacillus atrophaeus]MED4857023.1 SagB family peptide dehydrogenase [Bacillus atrophaeus]